MAQNNTAISGVGGSVSLPSGLDANVIAWSGTLEIDTIEVPPTFTYLFKQNALGTAKFTGVLEAKLDATSTNSPWDTITDAGAGTWANFTGTLTLNATSDKSISCTAVFNTIAISRPHNGYGTVTLSFANSTEAITMDFTTP